MRAIAGLLAASLAAPGCGGPPEPAPASVLLVSVDTLRADYLSANGYDRPTTPALDALIGEGAYFERALAPIARTTPALASLLTGAYPHRTGVRELTDSLDPGVVTLAELLRARGWQTLAVVTNEVLTPERELRRGFDVYDFRGSARTAALTTDAALRYLDVVDRGRPLFAWVHYVDPHVPYHPDERLAREFDPGYEGPYALHFGYQPRPGEPLASFRTYPEDLPKPVATHRNPLPERVNAHIRRLYAGDVRETDDAIARLVERFRAEHPQAIVVLTADHGESLGEHGFYFDHGDYVDEASLRVPLAIVPPAGHPLAGARRCREWVSLVDVAPTLLELFGEPAAALPERQREGRSLLGCLRGEPLAEVPVFAECGHAYYFDLVRGRRRNDVAGRFRSVTLDGWKLVWTPFAPAAQEWQLYHVAEDPGETRDLYAAEHPRVAALRAALAAWMARADRDEPRSEPSEDDRSRLRSLGYLE
jgi:arylsulfatase A-like enzyme